MGKVIIPDNEVWAWNGSILKPNPEHFEEGHTTGATGKKPRHDQFNYMEQRRDLNLQYLLRMAGLPYDPLEVYPINARASKNGHMYVSLKNNNEGNDPISSGKWKHEDDDKFPVGSIIFNAESNINPSSYKGFGEWEAIEDDVSFITSKSDVGSYVGANIMSVPLKKHTHDEGDLNFSGNIQYYKLTRIETDNVSSREGAASAPNTGNSNWIRTGTTAAATNIGFRVGMSLDTAVHQSREISGSVGESGVNDPTLDVRGRRLNVYAWVRVS